MNISLEYYLLIIFISDVPKTPLVSIPIKNSLIVTISKFTNVHLRKKT